MTGKGWKNPLRGKVTRDQLVKAAQEIDAFAKHNTRRQEVDGREPNYSSKQEVGIIEERRSSGEWRAYTVQEPVQGYGQIEVTRELRENLLPAVRMAFITKLCQAGVYNDFQTAKRFVLDELDFRCVESFVGKVQG